MSGERSGDVPLPPYRGRAQATCEFCRAESDCLRDGLMDFMGVYCGVKLGVSLLVVLWR